MHDECMYIYILIYNDTKFCVFKLLKKRELLHNDEHNFEFQLLSQIIKIYFHHKFFIISAGIIYIRI